MTSAIEVPAPAGGWPPPWLRLIEIAEHLPAESWMLVGGLMTQAHSMAAGIAPLRPTHDVDLIIRIGAGHNHVSAVVGGLRDMGYQVHESLSRHAPAHRLIRADRDQVDVAVADHLPPSTVAQIGRRDVFRIPGGTQAAQRVVPLRIAGCGTVGGIPDQLGALVLKGAAYMADSRDGQRHLADAAALAATITDPIALTQRFKGSDRRRIRTLSKALSNPNHSSWKLLPEERRIDARRTLARLAEPALAEDPDLSESARLHAQTFTGPPVQHPVTARPAASNRDQPPTHGHSYER